MNIATKILAAIVAAFLLPFSLATEARAAKAPAARAEASTDAAATDAGVTCQREDSLRIVSLLREAAQLPQEPASWMMWFGRKFIGVPYVAGTLDAASEERLVVNTRQLDCTTFVELATALTLCAKNHETSFAQFCRRLRHVRYVGGEVSYVKRQHYFTLWVDENAGEGIVADIQANPPFTAVQTVQVNWMTTHPANYRMLATHPQWRAGIRALEQRINGRQYRYVPKGEIRNNQLFRNTIHDGDIILIITQKKGLDTTHIGIASWHADGLHLLNASSIHHQVVDEPMTLYQYMQRHPSQIGIRACRVR